jgi:hypothetical protein
MRSFAIAALVGFTTASSTFRSNTWCAASEGLIGSQAECVAAAGKAGVNFASQAGAEWHAGCIIHAGSAYYVPLTAGASHHQAASDGYLCNNLKTHRTGTWCSVADGMIGSQAECVAAAGKAGVNFASQAGAEWHAGCIIHAGSAYYVPLTAGASHNQAASDGYLCNNEKPATTTTTTTTVVPVVRPETVFSAGQAPKCYLMANGETRVEYASALHPSFTCAHKGLACKCSLAHPTHALGQCRQITHTDAKTYDISGDCGLSGRNAVDGGFSAYGAWHACSKTCGTGTQYARRTCTSPAPLNGGAGCAGSATKSRNCNAQACPVDGTWNAWSNWGTCSKSCGAGKQVATRSCNQPTLGGKACDGSTTKSQACNHGVCPSHCTVSDFGAWSACSKSCGTGSRSRSRTVTAKAAEGGYACPYLAETQSCGTIACPIDGGWGSWSAPSACSKYCGAGTTTKTRWCNNPAPSLGGALCSGDSSANGACNEGACVPIDLSTRQPCAASSQTHGTTCNLAVDGDKRRDHPHEWHSAQGDQWMRVQLRAATTNPTVTFYARNCCTGQMGSSLRMYISDSDNLSQATDCGTISGIHDHSTNVAKCNGSGTYFWIRTIGSKTMNVPEFTVMGVPAVEIKVPIDLSTRQPCTASSESHGTTCNLAVDGDKRRDHPHEWHSYAGDQWMRVQLRAETTNPTVTFYARNCCTGQMGSSLQMYISNSNNLNQATPCGTISGIHDHSTNVAKCNGSGTYFWIRTIGGHKTMNVPEFTVMGTPNASPSKSLVLMDLSTRQPCTASSSSHGTTCNLALDGDKRRDHPHEWHSYAGDQWMRVQLRAKTTNPTVTFYARNCCTGQMGSSLRMYISDSDNLSQATDCGLITGIHDGSTNSAQCNGTGRFFWIRTIGSKTMNVPEFTVMGLA